MSINFKFLLNKTFESFLSIIAPKHCLVCGSSITEIKFDNEFYCIKCQNSLPYAPAPDIITDRLISGFSIDELFISKAAALLTLMDDNRYMNLIYKLKYQGFSRLGVILGRELGEVLKYWNMTDYDSIIPIPIHRARLRERGYNQSEKIGIGVVNSLEEIKISLNTELLIRKKYTISQTKMRKQDRFKNVQDIFKVNSNESLFGKTFLLIDDILTTGSTLNSAAGVLLDAGAKRVDVACIAIVGRI